MACIPPTLDGWVYIIPIHGPLDGPLYTWAQYTPTELKDNRSNLSFQGSSCSIDEVVDQFQLSSEAICFPMVISKCKWGS